MAARRRILLLFWVLLFHEAAWIDAFIICNNTGITSNLYIRRENSDYCYRKFSVNTEFSTANRSCIRQNGYLVKIDSQEENDYIMETYFSDGIDFWIGLTDQDDEGVFRWVHGNVPLSSNRNISYSDWFGANAAATNTESYDCVKFTAEGWKVHDQFCESSRLPYLCRQGVCESDDGLTCNRPPEPGATVSPVIIAVIVVIVVILIIVVVIVVLLLLMWKYYNDAFYRYILCCVYGGSKTQINNLKQENIRLRKELSQQKLSLNTSGRFQAGQLSRQNSVTSGPISINPPLSPDPQKRMLGNRSFSVASNRVAPLMSPQTSVPVLPGPKMGMGRSLSTVSAGSFAPIRAPLNLSSMRPVLPSVKEKTTPISEEVFPTASKQDRPDSADSSSSSSTTAASGGDDKKDNEKEEKKTEKPEDKEKVERDEESESAVTSSKDT